MHRSNRSIFYLVMIGVLMVVLAGVCGCKNETLSFSTEYQAVFMNNGQVFFGKLENAGADYPRLREVYYVQTRQNPETKEVKSILIKRGQEWHGPEYMYLNKQHIAVIEPVAAASRVAQLIKEAQSQKPAPAATQP